MQTEDRRVTVTGKGETMQRAFQDALNDMRKQLLKGKPEALLNADPVEVKVLKAIRYVWTEKFFGLFFARQRETYFLTIRFTVQVSFVDLTTIDVVQAEENPRWTQRVLQLK